MYSAVITAYCPRLSAATIVQNKAVAEQGLEEGEEEENRGREEVEDMGLGWMEACCTALELHADEPDVQVSPKFSCALQIQHIINTESFYKSKCLTCVTNLDLLRKLRAGPFTICYCTERE